MYTQLPRWTPRFFVFRCIYTNCISQETKRNVALAFKIYSCRGFPKWASNFRIILVPRGCVPFCQHQELRPLRRSNTVILRMLRVKSDNLIGWEYETITLRMLAKLDLPRDRDSWCLPKEAWPPGKRMLHKLSPKRMRVSSTSTLVCTRGTFVCLPVNLGDCFGVVFLNKLYGTD